MAPQTKRIEFPDAGYIEYPLIENPDYSRMSMRETLEFLKTNDVPGGVFRPLIERIVLELDRVNQRIDNL